MEVGLLFECCKDLRVDVTQADQAGCTPLWWASYYGNYEVIECLVAGGRDLGDVKNKKGKDQNTDYTTALEIAREKMKTEVVSLLERFLVNEAQTRHELRVKFGMLDELAAEVFCLDRFSVR